MMTHATTAFGVSGISMYMNQPVAPRAIAIWVAIVRLSEGGGMEHTTTAPDMRIERRPQRSTRYHLCDFNQLRNLL
jgi:hypothetical protein